MTQHQNWRKLVLGALSAGRPAAARVTAKRSEVDPMEGRLVPAQVTFASGVRAIDASADP